MATTTTVEYKHRSRCALGEGAVWDPHHHRLLWIDIVRGKLFSYDPDTRENRDVHLKQLLGTVVPLSKELCVVAATKGVAVVNQHTGEPKEFLGNPEADQFAMRWNDGKCDPQGRLWVGTMNMQNGAQWHQGKDAALYCFEGSGQNVKVSKKLDGVTISNGLVWNKAGDTFFYIDTPTMQLDAFDFDGATGAISNRRCAFKFPSADEDDFMGYPDGCTIAEDDTIFIACWGGGCVVRVNPSTGQLVKKYPLEKVAQVTSCAFGGKNLDQLFVTTASCGIEDSQLADSEANANAGHLFKIDLSSEGIRGVTPFSYKL